MIDIPRVYIAGPFSADTSYEVERNVRRAEMYIYPLAKLGVCPVCPHTMYRTFDGTFTYEIWIQITKALLKPCEAILMLPDWERSKGSRGERQDSIDVKRPIFYSPEFGILPPVLAAWVEQYMNRVGG